MSKTASNLCPVCTSPSAGKQRYCEDLQAFKIFEGHASMLVACERLVCSKKCRPLVNEVAKSCTGCSQKPAMKRTTCGTYSNPLLLDLGVIKIKIVQEEPLHMSKSSCHGLVLGAWQVLLCMRTFTHLAICKLKILFKSSLHADDSSTWKVGLMTLQPSEGGNKSWRRSSCRRSSSDVCQVPSPFGLQSRNNRKVEFCAWSTSTVAYLDSIFCLSLHFTS